MLSKWQQKIYDCDLDVIETIAVRGSGKTFLGMEWVSNNSDTAIILTHPEQVKYMRSSVSDHCRIYRRNKIHVVSNLSQIRKLNTNQKKRIKVVVDEYFTQPQINLNRLDSAIGHEKYKVLFIGSKTKDDDKFKIPFSKQFSVGLDHLLLDKMITPEQVVKILQANDGNFGGQFTTPFEIN